MFADIKFRRKNGFSLMSQDPMTNIYFSMKAVFNR